MPINQWLSPTKEVDFKVLTAMKMHSLEIYEKNSKIPCNYNDNLLNYYGAVKRQL